MKVSFYLKEVEDIPEDSITITIVRKNNKSQSVNSKKLDDLTAVEQQTIKQIISVVEKYGNEESAIKINSL